MDKSIYIVQNGDGSSAMVIVAHSAKQARQLAKKKIKEEELQEDYPVLDLTKYSLDVGIKYEFEDIGW